MRWSQSSLWNEVRKRHFKTGDLSGLSVQHFLSLSGSRRCVASGQAAWKNPLMKLAHTASFTFALCTFVSGHISGQSDRALATAPEFEVVSVKHSGSFMDGGRDEGGRHYFRQQIQPQLRGTKFRAEEVLGNIISFAFAPLVKPRRFEGWDWIYSEFYSIDANAPAGTTLESAQAMLRKVLVERLGLKYRLIDREMPIYALIRGSGNLRLNPAISNTSDSGAHKAFTFHSNSATMADLAGFLSTLTDREVLDRTGIQGTFKIDIDWNKQITDSMHDFGPHGDPTVVFTGIKDLGLRLESQKGLIRMMVLDRVNREPTPN